MAWKFWKLFGRSSGTPQPEAQAASPSPAGAATPIFPLFPSSGREVIALQRLVGNQIVLQLLERRRLASIPQVSPSAAGPVNPRHWWRFSSRSEKERA
jgi:hypothetical protein